MTQQQAPEPQEFLERPSPEAGQSIVLIALIFLTLLAFVGLAVDTGFAFVRSSQFSAAVDSATLAAVVDLDPSDLTSLSAPNRRAGQFLAANGWPTDTLTTWSSGSSLTEQGIPQYSYTATWPVQTFFMKIFGFESFPVSHSATAAFYAQSELYPTTAYERGHLRKASQFIFGPDTCTLGGDPVSPLYSTAGPPATPNEDWAYTEGVYRYRIRIPESYTQTNVVRIEIFDSDSLNYTVANNANVTHSISDGRLPETLGCGGNLPGQSCIIDTTESLLATNNNPMWITRVDENWLSNCVLDTSNVPGGVSGSVATVTEFELFYFDENGDREEIETYTENNGNPNQTDLKWYSPSGFEVDLDSLADLEPDDNGARYLYIDVSATAGTTKNVFDLWAGLPTAYISPTWPADVNTRNVMLADNPTLDASDGVAVFSLGRMPTQNWFPYNARVTLPLAPVDTTQAGGVIYISLFDYETGSVPPASPNIITFTVDSLAISDFYVPAEVVVDPDANPSLFDTSCNSSVDCNNTWFFPQLRIGIPETIFVGGTLEANYKANFDSHTWFVSITAGRPVLTR